MADTLQDISGKYNWELLPGAVSMIWTGTELITETAGYSDITAKKPIKADDLFWIASNTKAIACAIVLRLADQGLLDLNAAVSHYLPSWAGIKLANGKTPTRPPTLRDTLGHRSGLGFFPKMPITQWTVQELAEMAVRDGLDHEPGEYCYSNWGIDVAMAIAEHVGGAPWEVLLQKEVLNPLGMTETLFFPSPELCAERLAKSYRFDKMDMSLPVEMTIDQLVWPYNLPGAKAEAGGGLFSTAADLMKFYRMLAGKGVDANGNRFLSDEIMEEWYAISGPGKGLNYTFGTDVNAEAGTIGHGGAYHTSATADWKRGTARVFLTQVCGGNQLSRSFSSDWEDYASRWAGARAARPLITIGVLSDNQGYPYKEDWGFSNTEKALLMLKDMHPDVVVNCGDIADGDNPPAIRYYYDMVERILGKGIRQVACNGNHDIGLRAKRDGHEALADFQRAFGQYPGKQVTHEVINGFDFIALSLIVNEPYTVDECKLLEEELDKAVARDSVKPIFVLTHYHPYDTVLASSCEWGKNLRATLNRYPQVVSLCGHYHLPHQDPRTIWEGEFVAMDTASLSYGCVPDRFENMMSCLIPYGRECISFMLIEVFENYMRICGFNPESGRQIGEGEWIVQLPYRPERARYNADMAKERVAPEFADDAKIIYRYDFGFIYLLIDRPVKGDFTYCYRLRITELDSDGNDAGEPKDYFFMDDFYRLPRCRDTRFVIKAPPNSLQDGRTYRYEVFPRESFGKEGSPLVLTAPVFKGYTFNNIPIAYPQE